MISINNFLENMNPNTFEFFAMDFLQEIEGFHILRSPSVGPDAGVDLIVEKNNKIFLVSCKHSSRRDAIIGLCDDYNFSDRVKANNADGLICFYYANISTALYTQLQNLHNNCMEVIFIDRNYILNNYIRLNFFTLQKYNFTYNLNQNLIINYCYQPLNCLICKNDILAQRYILNSGGFLIVENDRLNFIYCCKSCFTKYCPDNLLLNELPYIELWQAFYPSNLNRFFDLINSYCSEKGYFSYQPHANLYLNWSYFVTGCSQFFMPEFTNPLPLL